MTTLVIDNYDSFTWNLVQLVGALEGSTPHVVRNDAITLDGVRALAPDRIILSPGPGHPADARRVGVCAAILAELAPSSGIPVLGVCLGHQAIVSAFGGRVVRGAPVHGKVSEIVHDGDAMFAGVPRSFPAMRYHSLVAERASLPPSLRPTAWCKDGTVMAVRHTRLPLFGVQFHPESIGTPVGAKLVATFLAVSLVACGGSGAPSKAPAAPGASPASAAAEPEPTTVEEAEAQIARARAELSGAPGTSSAPRPPAAPRDEASSATGSSSSADREAAAVECTTPCRALGSMRRAVDALCRMAGDEDARCRDAKRTLADSERRVSPCHC